MIPHNLILKLAHKHAQIKRTCTHMYILYNNGAIAVVDIHVRPSRLKQYIVVICGKNYSNNQGCNKWAHLRASQMPTEVSHKVMVGNFYSLT